VRADGRKANELRPLALKVHYIRSAAGSVLVELGGTRVVVTASATNHVPQWRRGQGAGWITAEYGMLPASTSQRKPRPERSGRVDGRMVEIQRLLGRSLRSVARLEALGERTIWIDADVLEADGGTRTAAITGGYVALALALEKMKAEGLVEDEVFTDSVAAVSVGMVGGKALLDLDYGEDAAAEVDMNVVMTGGGKLVEIQGTAEGEPFGRAELDRMLGLAGRGIRKLARAQKAALAGARGRRR
jgi:ribonuclease PH